MRNTTIILCLLLIAHQIYLPKINSIFWMEVCFIVAFYYFGGKLIHEYQRARRRKKYLKGIVKHHLSKPDRSKEYRSNIQVTIDEWKS